MFGLGGELSKEVDFVFILLNYFLKAHFVMFSGLLGFLFYKSIILNNLLFQKLDPFLQPKFLCVLLNLQVGKFKLCPIQLMLDWFHA